MSNLLSASFSCCECDHANNYFFDGVSCVKEDQCPCEDMYGEVRQPGQTFYYDKEKDPCHSYTCTRNRIVRKNLWVCTCIMFPLLVNFNYVL